MVPTLLLLTLGTVCLAAEPPGLVLRDLTPPISTAPLVNPGMGLYLFAAKKATDMPDDAWFQPLVNIGYVRDDWAAVQPTSDDPAQFEAYFKPIFELWVTRWHKRVAFRFMSQSMHSSRRCVTPEWVFKAGVPSVQHKGLYRPEQLDPVFWDEQYLAAQDKFIAQLGKYLDGRPGVEFIDIGGIGEWGEMHLARWTPQQLAQSGYTPQRYVAAYRHMIDSYARAFPHTRVFLNVGDWPEINDYAALRGVHFRQDGLNPAGPSADVGQRFYRDYSRRRIQCNYELHSGYREMKEKGWGLKATFDKGLEDPISYLHINLMGYGELAKAPAEVKDVVTDAARRIGYRFELTKLRVNTALRLDGHTAGRLVLDQTWRNAGVAPCYDSYALQWSLVDAAGAVRWQQVTYPKQPTSLWWPGATVTLRDGVRVPGDLPPGEYHLRVAMVKPEEPGLTIQLGLDGRDAAGRYELATMPVQHAERVGGVVYRESFAQGVGGWSGITGVTLARGAAGHDADGALAISGTAPSGAWNYASFARVKLLPLSRYRLSCWLKVDQLDADLGPYLKVGLENAAGRWINNFSTSPYDLSRRGTWQQLEGFVETTGETTGGHLALEKGRLEAKITAQILLDEVELELIESP